MEHPVPTIPWCCSMACWCRKWADIRRMSLSCGVTSRALERLIPNGWNVRSKAPLVLPSGPTGRDSEPEPDLAVVRGDIRDYATRHPRPADMALVVEVAESSLREDRAKLAATPGPEFRRPGSSTLTIELSKFMRIRPDLSTGNYQEMIIYHDGDEIPVVLDGRAVGRLAVVDLLP